MTLNTSSSIGSAVASVHRDEAAQNAHEVEVASLVSSRNRDARQLKLDIENQTDSTGIQPSTATVEQSAAMVTLSSASLACTHTVLETEDSVHSQVTPHIVVDGTADCVGDDSARPPVITVSGPCASQDYSTAAASVGPNGGEITREIQDILSLTDPRVVGTSSPARTGPSVSPCCNPNARRKLK
ncbi:hypothetical protein C8R42DRAFT_146055 [Lentinula raphanica]|nr:hypothetical protein C8R42DRAFT_146055 [Lentinula raphanica]